MKLKNALIIVLMTIAILMISNINVFAKTVIVDTDTLRLRKEPSKDSTTIELLDNGTKLEFIAEEDEWYKVKYKGIVGYVSKDFSKIEEDEKTNTQKETVVEQETKVEETKEEVEEKETTTQTDQEETTQVEVKEMKLLKDTKVYILPLINANTIQNIKKDDNVKIISKTNGWVYVETDEVMGWIRQDTVMTVETTTSEDTKTTEDEEKVTKEQEKIENKTEVKEEKEETQKSTDTEITSKIMYVNTASIYVRKGPGTNYEIIDSLVINDTVKVVAENGDWYKVELADKTGYIAKRLLSNSATSTTTRSSETRNEVVAQKETANKETTNNETASSSSNSNVDTSKGQQIVDFAKKYLGCKYVYGGSGPSTFDCSGFTMYVFKNFGITLSHSAIAQSKVGSYVPKENLQPGDLVFFTDYETGEGIGHVGIYIGNGDFIHASSGTGYCVKISTLLTGSYYNRYNTARRLF